ncbi:MAG: insulinase family protein [Armatimonadetes bacterium]|nr:MAG: insulinase family protein [Armatimonadota bacterium]
MNYHKFVLKNGLRVIIVPIEGVESATTMVMVGAGSRYENKNNNGISHFLEHMAFKGTKKRPTAREIATLIDGIGAEQNAFTGKELTGYYIKSTSKYVNFSLDILSDMLLNSKLDSEEINRERGVILEEINLYEDTPIRKIGDIFERLLYGDTSMGWDIAGEKNVIKQIQREDFVNYINKLYAAGNMTVVVAGNVAVDKTLSDIELSFSPLPSFETKSYEKAEENVIEKVFIKQKKTEQAHFALGVKTVGLLDEKDKYPLSILASILGGGMSSRLFHEIRERRGLAYYVRTFSENYVDTGYTATFAGVDPRRIDEAIKVVIEEYNKVCSEGEITEQELVKAREYVKGHFVLELEDSKSVAAFYAASEILENKLENPTEIMKKIDEVKLEDICRVAEDYFKNSALRLAIIGDFEDKERFEKLLV